MSGLRKGSPVWQDTLLGSGMWFVNGTCQWNLAMIFSRHDVQKMLMKSCLPAGTYLNRIKVIRESFFSYTKSFLHILTFSLFFFFKKKHKARIIHSSNHFSNIYQALIMYQTLYWALGLKMKWDKDYFRQIIIPDFVLRTQLTGLLKTKKNDNMHFWTLASFGNRQRGRQGFKEQTDCKQPGGMGWSQTD